MPSAKSKQRSSTQKFPSGVTVGDLVYLASERSKLQARDKYLVTRIQDDSCTVRKFTRQQFRKKEYLVPLRDVYPIVNHPSCVSPPAVEESSDTDDDALDVAENVIAQDVVDVEGEETEGNAEEQDAGPVLRPRREARRPVWHSDYEMSV